ncbi:MAG TPA: ABC transporter substrate-binding protein [Longimicrobium sp.]|uniref:ABC transporter substrate-binding protein n=1 Tax=Longimicrobium sp. TaxID=2029185 RepID=UPI002ED9C3CF
MRDNIFGLPRLAAAILAAAAALARCGGGEGEKGAAAPVRFGVVLSTTGAAAPYGIDNLRGLQVAQEYLNEQGGIHGRPVELVVHDDAGEPAQAVALARRFAGDRRVTGIVGPTRTGTAVAVARVLPSLRIPMMSVGATGDWRAAAGEFNEWTFRSTRVDTYLIPPLLRTARDSLGVRTVAIVSTGDDDWSRSTLAVYRQTLRELGMRLVAEETQMTGDADRSAQLTRIRAAAPDALVINTLASDAPTIADQARRMGIRARFLGTAGFTTPQTWKLAGPGVLDGTLVADNYDPGSARPIVGEFIRRYRARFQADPPPYAAYAFDGLLLMAEAARRAPDPADRRAVRDALGTIRDFEAVLGRVSYRGRGDADKPAVVRQIQGSGVRQVP